MNELVEVPGHTGVWLVDMLYPHPTTLEVVVDCHRVFRPDLSLTGVPLADLTVVDHL